MAGDALALPVGIGAEPELDLMLRVAALADCSRSFAIGAVATLGLANHFQKPQAADTVATESGLDAEALRRLLRSLVKCGLFAETETGSFVLTPVSEFLLDANPYNLRAAYSLFPADIQAWAELGFSLRSGDGAFPRVHGRSLWDYLSEHPEAAAQFDRSMEEMSRLEMLWVPEAYDWAQFRTVADIGGGNGTSLLSILEAFPALQGVLFDLPEVIARVGRQVRAGNLSARCRLEGGDFFKQCPEGYDAYILKRIIYSYDDADAARILQAVRRAMRHDSALLLLEPVRRGSSAFDYGKLLDVQMLVLGSGRVRDRHELRALLKIAGLRLRRIIPTAMTAIVVAVPA
jgi:hypothetical protein